MQVIENAEQIRLWQAPGWGSNEASVKISPSLVAILS
jgi:hypothetical protein